MIKNIIFDFGGVLIDLDRQRCIDNFKKLGLQNIDELIGNFAQQGIFMQLEKGLISSQQFRERVRELIGDNTTDDQIDAAWNSFLLQIPTYKLDALLELRKKYSLYLLSNTNAIHWEWSLKHVFPYKGYNETDYFRRIYLSYELKQVKPEPEIFKLMLDDAGIQPEESWFIDDSEANCRTAESLGIRSYCCNPQEDWRSLFK
ncbi:MAG: HAD family phosphatase [Bacteroides sp.]|nr:HAD family phosphatase [Bacteroides sp.]